MSIRVKIQAAAVVCTLAVLFFLGCPVDLKTDTATIHIQYTLPKELQPYGVRGSTVAMIGPPSGLVVTSYRLTFSGQTEK